MIPDYVLPGRLPAATRIVAQTGELGSICPDRDQYPAVEAETGACLCRARQTGKSAWTRLKRRDPEEITLAEEGPCRTLSEWEFIDRLLT